MENNTIVLRKPYPTRKKKKEIFHRREAVKPLMAHSWTNFGNIYKRSLFYLSIRAVLFLKSPSSSKQNMSEFLKENKTFHIDQDKYFVSKIVLTYWEKYFLTFPACFWIPIIFSNLNYNCSNFLDLRNLQEQVKKAFCYQELFWPFTVWINCSSDLKNVANSRPSASNFKSFSRSLKQFFLTVGQNNFGNKIPFLVIEKNF
jgi:hypothetical protein